MKNNEIAKSSILIQKELELKTLLKRKAQTTTSIKATKIKLANLQTEAERVGKEMANSIARLADLGKLSKEIKMLLAELAKKVKLSRRDKSDLNDVIGAAVLDDISEQVDEMFAQTPFGNSDNFHSGEYQDAEANTDEFNRQRRHEMFGKYAVKVDEAEQQKIRKVFIELANRFHPDKAGSEQERKLFNDLMQSINGAYQNGDLDELLDIKERFKSYQISDADSNYDIPVIDALEAQLVRSRNELQLLESQLLRLKTEFKNLKNSDMGAMVKGDKQAGKHGGDSSAMSDGTQALFEMLDEMKKIIIEWTETGKRPHTFTQFANGTHPVLQKSQAFAPPFEDDDDDGFSEEELMEMLSLFNAMNEMGGSPKGKRRR
jgi:hypothetical protein